MDNRSTNRNYRYETEHFILRQVTEEDAPALLQCYSDPAAVALMNDDNCQKGFLCPTLADMQEYIRYWNEEYDNGYYIRPAVVQKATGQALGTLEVFGGETGVLRVDLRTDYEREDVLRELYRLAVEEFIRDFPMGAMVTKAVPAAGARRKVLAELGFAGPERFRDYPDYYRMPAEKMRDMDERSLSELLDAVLEIDKASGVHPDVYVVEECAELIKELTKAQRGKGSTESVVDEACDVLTTVAILLREYGVGKDETERRIRFKATRALERFRRSGEI